MKDPAANSTSDRIPTWRRLTREQLGQLIGVHQDTIADYTREGMPVVSVGRGRGKKSVYDAVACLEWWRLRQGKGAKDAAQTRAFEAQAKLNELKFEREMGEVVSRAAVLEASNAHAKGLIAQLRSLPRRLTQSGVITREQEASVLTVLREVVDEVRSWKTIDDMEAAVERIYAAAEVTAA